MTDEPRDRVDGALTGATGDLLPPEADEAFVPAERRAIEDDAQQVAVSGSMHRQADELRQGADAATAGGGYGGSHGLAPDDPNYAMSEATYPEPASPPVDPVSGSDERIDPAADRY
ncbi:MAG TPA: hypothetical protein VFM19_10060 [Candidatus Limnocylindria bacterium]|nr:hypothetical protein [Candidatus Limnocylindria bacterium]